MSRRNGKKKKDKLHTNKLLPSTQDMVRLAYEVEQRFLILTQSYYKATMQQLDIPESLSKGMFLWRTMRVRHMKGDYRNTEDEKKSTCRIAQWTITENCKLKGQDNKILEWDD